LSHLGFVLLTPNHLEFDFLSGRPVRERLVNRFKGIARLLGDRNLVRFGRARSGDAREVAGERNLAGLTGCVAMPASR
jgi:hypothetical protein